MASQVTLEIEGLKPLRTNMQRLASEGDGSVKAEWQVGLAELGVKAAAMGASAAPRGRTDDLAASVRSRVAKAATVQAKVSARAKHGGFPYGLKLEKHGPYRAWLFKAVQKAVANSGAVLEAVARRIEARFFA